VNDATGMPQKVLVVGGSSEIAGHILERLARRRASHVLLAGRQLAEMETVCERLRAAGTASAEVMALDLSDSSSLTTFARQAAERLGGIDLVLFAAGNLGTADLDELDAETVSAMTESNFSGQAALAIELAKDTARRGGGRLVFLSSVAGVRVRRANFVYGAAKAGLDGFAIGLSEALYKTGVKVMVVRPGFVRTKMTAGRPEAPFAVGPEEVADAVVQGLEKDRAVVWVPAQLQLIFAIFRLLPQSVWRRLPG
jgi:decaprenylphospho-beta-D-erythro-pentofuranosid-2-ulose 2-reductase